MMNKIATTLLVSSLALGAFSLANADEDRYEHHERYEHSEDDDRYENKGYKGKYCDKHGKKSHDRMEYMIKHLDLSDEQATQVRSIRDRYQPKTQALREKMQETRKQLREEMHAENIDQNKVSKLAKVMGDLKAEKIILRAEKRNSIHKVLTEEQRKTLKEMKHRGYKYKHGHHS